MHRNEVIIVIFTINNIDENESNCDDDSDEEYNDESILVQQILIKSAIGYSDASTKNKSMAGKWIITTEQNEKVNERQITLRE